MPLLVARAKASKASALIVQEMGADQAPGFFAAMGSGWHYDRAGLNVVGWNGDWTWQTSNPLNLSSFGQMQRTLLAVNLAHATGKAVRLASTHLAAAASDLTEAQAVAARATQAAEVTAALALDPVPTLLGADWNSRAATDTGNSAPRKILTALGWTFDQTDIIPDAKHGIDGTAANYGMSITSSQVVDLGIASDHDGRLVVATTT
jgi:endonuclease/exonuclease/phosphatase family metal-dependent hydrolase